MHTNSIIRKFYEVDKLIEQALSRENNILSESELVNEQILTIFESSTNEVDIVSLASLSLEKASLEKEYDMKTYDELDKALEIVKISDT